ncbi:MAG: hypothetical protein J6N19_12865 [Clostridium sp.]|nr:hypothetical protein [Clostridium sp.]
MNPLYQQTGQNNVMQRFLQFKQQFRGNPQEQVQQLLNSGRISQAQYDQAVQMANQLRNMMNL